MFVEWTLYLLFKLSSSPASRGIHFSLHTPYHCLQNSYSEIFRLIPHVHYKGSKSMISVSVTIILGQLRCPLLQEQQFHTLPSFSFVCVVIITLGLLLRKCLISNAVGCQRQKEMAASQTKQTTSIDRTKTKGGRQLKALFCFRANRTTIVFHFQDSTFTCFE